jgi:hypothetical protein
MVVPEAHDFICSHVAADHAVGQARLDTRRGAPTSGLHASWLGYD